MISDAGTPTLSDPGHHLISLLKKEGIKICPIPGPSAITTLLSASGFSGNCFHFEGFFPRNENEAIKTCHHYETRNHPCIFFESPKRILKTLKWLNKHYEKAQCTIGKELTKKFENIIYGSPQDCLEQLLDTPIKGEWTLAILFPKREHSINIDFLKHCKTLNLSQKDIITLTTKLGWKKNDVYEQLLQIKQ